MAVCTLLPGVIPLRMADQAGEPLRHVLVHEFAHIKRGDAWIGALQRLLLIAAWPQPLIRYASSELSRAREELCDNYVLKIRQPVAHSLQVFKVRVGAKTVG